MAKTLEEARLELIGAGYIGDPSPEVLRQYGWEPSDDAKNALAVEVTAPARSPEQVKDDIHLLYEEAKRNNVPSQILGMIGKVGGSALKLLFPV